MKRNMKLGTITAVVVVGLMVASAFTSMAARPTSPTPSLSEKQIVDTILKGHASGAVLKRTTLTSVDRSSSIYTAQAVKLTNHAELTLDGQPVIAGGQSGSADIPVAGGDRAETFRFEQHPTVADSGVGDIILAHRVVNDTYPNVQGRNPVTVIYGANGYGATDANWSAPYIPKYVPNYPQAGTPIRWDYPSFSYYGVEQDSQLKEWFGFAAEKNNAGTIVYNESGRVSILRIQGNNPKNLNDAMFRFRPWFGLSPVYTGITSPSIASDGGLRFYQNNTHWIFWPNGTHKPYALHGGGGEPFGLIAYTVEKDTANLRMRYSAHIAVASEEWRLPVRWPPVGESSNPYMVTYSWTPEPQNVTTTSTAIDSLNKWGYFAFDPKDTTTHQRAGMFGYINDMHKVMLGWSNGTVGDLQSLPDLDVTAFTWTMGSTLLDIEKPSIAGYGGAVVAANELNNRSDPTDNYLELWYNNLYNGSTWGDSEANKGWAISGLWYNTQGSYFRNPIVQHYEGMTFYMTVTIDNPGSTPDALAFAISYDGGATWGAADQIYLYTLYGGNDGVLPPVMEPSNHANGNNEFVWVSSPDQDHINVYMDYITGVIKGRTMISGSEASPDATVDIYNTDLREDQPVPARFASVKSDANGYFTKKCFLGIELWNGSNMTIIANNPDTQMVGFKNVRFLPLGFVNNAGDVLMAEHYRDLTNFPFYWAYDASHTPAKLDTGVTTGRMMLNYLWWDQRHNATIPEHYAYDDLVAIFDPNGDHKVTGDEMTAALNSKKPLPIETYGYFFNPDSSTDRNAVLQQICVWLDFTYGQPYYPGLPANWPAPGHITNVPISVPFGGNYNHWIAVRGLWTNQDAWANYPNFPTITINGFWINDPLNETGKEYYGMPGKTFMTLSAFNAQFLPLNVPGDAYNGKYFAVMDPPQNVDTTKTTGNVVAGINPAQFTPLQAKIVAKGTSSDLAKKTIGDAARNAALNVLKNNVHQIGLVYQFEHASISKIVKVKNAFQVTFDGVAIVEISATNGALNQFTLI